MPFYGRGIRTGFIYARLVSSSYYTGQPGAVTTVRLSRWAMRTPGSRPAVGRRRIVADKSSQRGITSTQQRSRPTLYPLCLYLSDYVARSFFPVRFASSRSLLRLFLPFLPCSSLPPFSIRCVIFEAQAHRPSREWDDDLRSRASFQLPSIRVEVVSRTFPSPPYLADLSSWFRRSIYDRCTRLPVVPLFVRSLASLLACLLASLPVVREK